MFLNLVTPLVPIFVARVLSPTIVFLSAFTLFSAHLQPPNSPSPITPVVVATTLPRRALILTLLSLISLTYFLDGISFVVFAVLDHHWPSHSGIPINTITGVIAFSGLAALGTWKDVHGVDVWSLKRVKVAVAGSLALDLSLAVLLTLHLRQPETAPVLTVRTLVHVIFPALRVLLLAPLLAGLVTPRITYSSVQTYDDVETPAVEPTVSTFLLAPDSGSQPSTGLAAVTGTGDSSKYGTFRNNRSTLQASAPTTRAATPAPSTGPDTKQEPKPEISFEPSWSELWGRIRRLSPHLWPKKDRSLQFVAVVCIIILLLGRVINLAMPITLSKLIEVLEGRSNQSPWLYLLGYVGLRFLQGSGGLSAIRDSLWTPVMQYSDRVAVSVILTTWRTRLRRQMNERDVATRGIHTDCLLNYETVKYFGGEEHEGQRYSEAIQEYQALEYRVILSLNLLNLVQNFIITSGLLIGSFMVAYDITSGDTPGASKFVFFITYLAQLYGPLNQLGYIYRSVNQSLVDTEKLLALLNEPTEVNDKENAPELVVYNGEIEFDNVHFSYDGRASALNGVSFKVPKGGSVALVGESGAGKSTILRLLYRFYDLGEGQGRILIDGQDIRDVTQKSLRQAIGVVPQDSVLFNSSIRYNIGYGKFDSSLEEIEAAAKSAQMHERIMSFPEGYNTKVGERGVRLSGGEKQRVAIARTLLKNPPILLLDEATSALDTSTEKDIQKALQNLVKGRSSLSIAHRLSTIASADIILVLKDGHVAEQGNFKELLELDGLFASMWADQISSNDDPAVSLIDSTVKKELSGYNVETADRSEEAQTNETVAEVVDEAIPTDLAASTEEPENSSQVNLAQTKPDIPIDDITTSDAQPSQDESNIQPVIHDEQQVAQPIIPTEIASPVPSAAIAFPTSDSRTNIRREKTPPPISSPPTVSFPAVTFGASVNSPPSRTGTPDPESEPKRKRISSQNFQRLARRISLTTRRGSSSSGISGLKRDQSPKVSIDESRSEGSGAGPSNESPAASVKGDDKSKLKKEKKEKKEKNKKNTI
ncbi:hypothetical protein CVT25_012198 [Psilocybe cyanescens]|uniref:ABC transporter domain-containing protein n=1 Tax=Psilocybe cyanescens TaxID=93625 RepID=A0A409XFJ2_PSICY|nr:hypothetical protein CVT25_012198 [Psilocybe cyanescens]